MAQSLEWGGNGLEVARLQEEEGWGAEEREKGEEEVAQEDWAPQAHLVAHSQVQLQLGAGAE